MLSKEGSRDEKSSYDKILIVCLQKGFLVNTLQFNANN